MNSLIKNSILYVVHVKSLIKNAPANFLINWRNLGIYLIFAPFLFRKAQNQQQIFKVSEKLILLWHVVKNATSKRVILKKSNNN